MGMFRWRVQVLGRSLENFTHPIVRSPRIVFEKGIVLYDKLVLLAVSNQMLDLKTMIPACKGVILDRCPNIGTNEMKGRRFAPTGRRGAVQDANPEALVIVGDPNAI